MLPYVPFITKICSVIVMLIALWIMMDALVNKRNENGKYRRRWMLLAISCMVWGILVWFPLISIVAEHARVQMVFYLLRLFSLCIGVWAFLGLYKAGELSLKKRETSANQ